MPFGNDNLTLTPLGDFNVQDYFLLNPTNGLLTVARDLSQQAEDFFTVRLSGFFFLYLLTAVFSYIYVTQYSRINLLHAHELAHIIFTCDL